ncbi:transposase [Vibrio alginolyticus]|nr:putative secreted protein [Vibrio alginolyticus]SUP17750.1 transposase [Vibrio alginolyticus]
MSNWKPTTVSCRSTIKVTWSPSIHSAKESAETAPNQSTCRVIINIRSGRLDACSTKGANIGPAMREAVNKMLNSKPHPEQSYRSCLELLNLNKAHGESRLKQACNDALMLTKPNYTFISNLLKNNREGQLSKDKASTPNLVHSNVRGPNCYH